MAEVSENAPSTGDRPSEAHPPDSTPRVPASPGRTRRVVWAVGGALVALGLAFAAGYIAGSSAVQPRLSAAAARTRAVEAERAQALAGKAEAEAETERARAAQRAQRQRVRLLESRRALDRTLDDLDARNFGIATQRMNEVSERLMEHASTRELASQVRAHRVEVSADLEAQRGAIRGFVRELDGLLDRL